MVLNESARAVSVSSFLSYVCVCISPVSNNCSRSRFLPLSRKLRCVRVCARVCVFILMFSLECARVGLFPKRRTEKRDFSITVFPTTFSSLSGRDGLYPNPRTQTLLSVFFCTKIIEQKIRPKNISSAFIIAHTI